MHRSSQQSQLKIATAALMSVVLAMLWGCDSNSKQVLNTTQSSRVAWVTDQPESLRWEAICRAVAHKAPQYPFLRNLPPFTPDSASDGVGTPSIANQLALAVGAEAQFVVLWLQGDTAPMEAITAAEQNGVTVVTIDRNIPRDRAANHVDIHLPAAAEQLGRDLSQLSEGRQAFILIHHRDRDPEANRRYARFRTGLSAQSEMVMVGEADATGRDPVAMLNQLLELYPGTALVVTLESDLWLLPEAKSIRDDVRYITLDASPALWPDLKTGRALALIGPVDGEIGEAALSLVADLATSAKRPLPNRVVECRIVSKSNLSEFAAAYAESVGVPPEKLMP